MDPKFLLAGLLAILGLALASEAEGQRHASEESAQDGSPESISEEELEGTGFNTQANPDIVSTRSLFAGLGSRRPDFGGLIVPGQGFHYRPRFPRLLGSDEELNVSRAERRRPHHHRRRPGHGSGHFGYRPRPGHGRPGHGYRKPCRRSTTPAPAPLSSTDVGQPEHTSESVPVPTSESQPQTAGPITEEPASVQTAEPATETEETASVQTAEPATETVETASVQTAEPATETEEPASAQTTEELGSQ